MVPVLVLLVLPVLLVWLVLTVLLVLLLVLLKFCCSSLPSVSGLETVLLCVVAGVQNIVAKHDGWLDLLPITLPSCCSA